MLSDSEVLEEVLEELRWDPIVAAVGIQVTIRDGIVTLRGEVPSFAAKVAAEEDAARVPGVRAVQQELLVREPSRSSVLDAEIAANAVEALQRNVFVPAGSIVVHVECGKITLSGRVNNEFERSAAERALRHIPGVQELTALVVVSPELVPKTPGRHSAEGRAGGE